MTRRILGLIVTELVVVAGGLVLLGRLDGGGARLVPFAAFAAAYVALRALPPLHLEFRRNAYSLVLDEPLLLVSLFAMPPLPVVAAALVGELVMLVFRRQPPLKAAFNLVQGLGGVVVAALTFSYLGQTDALHPAAWLSGLAALVTLIAFNTASMATVLAISEGNSFRRMAARLLPTAGLNFPAAASLSVAAVILFDRTPLAPLLFVPVLAILVLSTRGLEDQRAQRDRFERLYAASSDLARLVDVEQTAGTIATRAKDLVTGAVGIAVVLSPDGRRTAVVVDDDGPRPAGDALATAVADLPTAGGSVVVSSSELPDDLSATVPGADHVVWAAGQHADVGVMIAVVRDIPTDDSADRRAEILSAYAQHASLVAGNAALHERVREALDRQIDLNRHKSDFVATVSHELRTPLTTMLGALQTVRRLGERLPDDERDRLLSNGVDEGHRLRRLIEDLLLVAAAEHHDVRCDARPVDVAVVIGDVAAQLAAMAGCRVRVSVDEAVGVVATDEDKFRRILLNLVENAAKYAPEGPIDVTAERRGIELVVSVSDHGPGIPEADRARVFERFVQLDQSSTRRQGGTGLGLHLCRQLAGVLGGSLGVSASPGGGACFAVRLPAEPAGTAVPSDVPARPARILARPDGVIRSSALAGVARERTPALTVGRSS